jgi:hypothetical protein
MHAMVALRLLAVAVATSAILVGASVPAGAQQPGQEALEQFCSGDYMRLCAQYDPDSPQVEQCFRSKMRELTPACRSAIQAYQKRNPQGRKR